MVAAPVPLVGAPSCWDSAPCAPFCCFVVLVMRFVVSFASVFLLGRGAGSVGCSLLPCSSSASGFVAVVVFRVGSFGAGSFGVVAARVFGVSVSSGVSCGFVAFSVPVMSVRPVRLVVSRSVLGRVGRRAARRAASGSLSGCSLRSLFRLAAAF